MEETESSSLNDENNAWFVEKEDSNNVPIWHDYTNVSPWEEFVHDLEMAIKEMVFNIRKEVNRQLRAVVNKFSTELSMYYLYSIVFKEYLWYMAFVKIVLSLMI